MVKNMPANAGDMGSIPGSGRYPLEKGIATTPEFLPGVKKELDMTEQLNNNNNLLIEPG